MPADPAIERYHDARAEAYAEVEGVVEDTQGQLADRFAELMAKPEERDPIIWADYLEYNEVDANYFLLDDRGMNALPMNERAKEWHNALDAMADAALAQAYTEILMLPMVAEMQAGTLTTFEAANALTAGKMKTVGATGLARFDGAKKKRADRKAASDGDSDESTATD